MADKNTSATTPAMSNVMTTLMPTTLPTPKTSPMPTKPLTYPMIETDPSLPVMEEGIYYKNSPMPMPLPAVIMAVMMTAKTPSQLMFIPTMPTALTLFTLTQIFMKPTLLSTSPHQ